MPEYITVEYEGHPRTVWIPNLTEPDEVMEHLAQERAANLVTTLQEASMWFHRLPIDHEYKPVFGRWMRLARGEVIHRMTA